jgi:hypothetical protein
VEKIEKHRVVATQLYTLLISVMINGKVARFEVQTAVTMKIPVVYDVTPCSLGNCNDLPHIKALHTR